MDLLLFLAIWDTSLGRVLKERCWASLLSLSCQSHLWRKRSTPLIWTCMVRSGVGSGAFDPPHLSGSLPGYEPKWEGRRASDLPGRVWCDEVTGRGFHTRGFALGQFVRFTIAWQPFHAVSFVHIRSDFSWFLAALEPYFGLPPHTSDISKFGLKPLRWL